jgi:hypothetical protein
MAQRARGAEIIGGARASDRREAWAPTPRPAVSDHHRGGNVAGRTGACLSRASSSTEQMERPTAPGAEEIARVNDARSLLHATYPPAAMNVPLNTLRNGRSLCGICIHHVAIDRGTAPLPIAASSHRFGHPFHLVWLLCGNCPLD